MAKFNLLQELENQLAKIKAEINIDSAKMNDLKVTVDAKTKIKWDLESLIDKAKAESGYL